MKMTLEQFMQRYADWQESEKREADERRVARAATAADAGKVFKAAFEKYGGHIMSTNGYAYEARVGELVVSFVDQGTRVCGQMHRVLTSNAEREAVVKAWLLPPHLSEEFKRLFRYEDFIYDGTQAQCAEVMAKRASRKHRAGEIAE